LTWEDDIQVCGSDIADSPTATGTDIAAEGPNVYVGFRDRRTPDAANKYDVYVAASNDYGVTFPHVQMMDTDMGAVDSVGAEVFAVDGSVFCCYQDETHASGQDVVWLGVSHYGGAVGSWTQQEMSQGPAGSYDIDTNWIAANNAKDVNLAWIDDRAGGGNATNDVYSIDFPYYVQVRSGNVGAGDTSTAAIENVLFANGSAGDVYRVYDHALGTSITVRMEAPSNGPNPSNFVLYLNTYEIGVTDLATLPYGLGDTALNTPLSKGNIVPQPYTVANTIGFYTALGAPLLTVPNGAPVDVFTFPSMPPGSYSLQGLMFDNGSAGPNFSITNAIIIKVS
jgi:hypothetical protein